MERREILRELLIASRISAIQPDQVLQPCCRVRIGVDAVESVPPRHAGLKRFSQLLEETDHVCPLQKKVPKIVHCGEPIYFCRCWKERPYQLNVGSCEYLPTLNL